MPASAPDVLLDVAEELAGRPEIVNVVVKSASASLIIRYDPRTTDQAALAAVLRELGVSPRHSSAPPRQPHRSGRCSRSLTVQAAA